MKKENTTFAVRKIIQSENGYSQVVIDRATFDAIACPKPDYEYKTSKDSQGRGLRVYTFKGVTVWSRYNKSEHGFDSHIFVMRTADAEKHLKTLEDERASQVAERFSF